MKHIMFLHKYSFYMLSRWLRRKLKKWRPVFARIPKAVTKTVAVTVLVVGALLGGGGQDARAQTNRYINYEQSNGSHEVYGWTNPPTDDIWGLIGYAWDTTGGPNPPNDGWSAPSNRFDTNNLWTALSNTTANTVTVHISGNVTPGNPTGPTNPTGIQTRYRSNWGATTNTGGTANVTGGRVTLVNERTNLNYNFGNWFKTGGGELVLAPGTQAGTTVYGYDDFTGSGGTLTVQTTLTGSTTGTTTVENFTANVDNGITWTAPTVNASGTFTKGGMGTLATVNTTIIGTSNLEDGGNWWVTNSLQVGNGNANGILNITDGTMGGSSAGTGIANSYIGARGTNNTGTGTVNVGGSGTWRTVATYIGNNAAGSVENRGTWTGTGLAQIGGSAANATGTVTNYSGNSTTAGWTNSGQVTVGGSGANATGTVTNTGRMDWTEAAGAAGDSLIGQAAKGTVNNNGSSAIWNTSNNVIVGAGAGGGEVNTSGTWRVGPTGNLDVVVGQNGVGYVHQSAGTWNNRFTDVGHGTIANATGSVLQDGGSHDDEYVRIGNTTDGSYTLDGATWNTTGEIPGVPGVGAEIGVEANVVGIVNVKNGGTWNIDHSLTTGKDGHGNLYVSSGGKTKVSGDHIIAENVGSIGRDYIDGYGTAMTVGGTLTVGNFGQAGGTYTEDRSLDRYRDDPADWFADGARTLDMNLTVGDADNATTGKSTGNAPGLAITRGANVTSGKGVIGAETGSNGYVVIDNAGNTAAGSNNYYTTPVGTVYDPLDNEPPFFSGSGVAGIPSSVPVDDSGSSISKYASVWNVKQDLKVGDKGNAFLRVLNGGALVVNGTGDSTIIAAGSSNRGQLFVSGNDANNGGRSVFKSYGATVVGDAGKRGTLRIYDGALGETAGLYIGAQAGAEGEVFVDGPASTLRITADKGSSYYNNAAFDVSGHPQVMGGTGLFGASHQALVWLDADSAVRLNGCAVFASNSVLHLDNLYKMETPVIPKDPYGTIDRAHNPLFDAGNKRVNFVNARLEGIGTVTGKDGVHFFQCDAEYGQAAIDPGLVYDWTIRCEKDFYGDLYFGHSLTMTGNVITYFDINSGYYDPSDGSTNNNPMQDNIYVIADPRNVPDEVSATLGGTLMIHARLTEYYPHDTDWYNIVQTFGEGGTGGVIHKGFDDIEIKPWRFFSGREQEIYNDGKNDILRVRMSLNESPFEEATNTYNQMTLGRVLDSIYALRKQEWLPFLRTFWYLDDPEFLEEYRNFSGEIRAHALMMPLQNPWTYAHARNGFSRCTRDAFFGPQNRSCNIVSDKNLWGTFIHTNNWTSSDDNAGSYHLTRNGIMAGYERASKGGHSYLGALISYNQGKLDAGRSDAKSDDFQFGLYHGKTAWDNWEWKNFLGIGVQNYNMSRDVDLNLSHSIWNPTNDTFECVETQHPHIMKSQFTGFSFAGSTELARPFYFGKCCQWTMRPYMGLDLMAVWQNRASEYGDNDDTYEVHDQKYLVGNLVALNYYSATNVRVYARPGVMVERGGSHGNLRMGVSYSHLMGGHPYTNVNNQFQFAGDKFNIRGVDDGLGFVTANVGAGIYVGKRKLSMVYIDYAVMAGGHSTTHAGQLGFQRNF